MIVAVLSDTHLEQPDDRLEAIMDRYCRAADVLLHCGDCVGADTWAYLNSHPRFFAVQGNCDLPPLRGVLPAVRELNLHGFRVGMAHGWGARSRVWSTVADQFPDADIVCYGHTHIRDWRQLPSGMWILNPGSLFWPRAGAAGLALLTLELGQEPTLEWVDGV